MSSVLRKYAAPFLAMPVVFDTPKRPDFAIRKFTGMVEAIKLLWYYRKHPELIVAEAVYNDAVRAHSIGRFQQAEEDYNKCIRIQPDHEPAYTNLASLYLERNSHDLAVEELKKGLKVRPHFFRGYYNLGLVYRQQGRLDEAVAMLEKALSLKPKHFCSYVVLAEIHVSMGSFDTALSFYKKSLPHCDTPHSLYIRLAELYLKQNKVDACERCLRTAAEYKDSPELEYNLGWLLIYKEGEPEEMVDCFLKASKARADFKEALLNLSLCQAAAGYHEQSVNNMIKYVETFGKKTADEMLNHLNFLREIHPGNHLAAMRVAQLLIDNGQVQKAIEVLSGVLKSINKYSPAVEMLANIYRTMGRHKDAIKTYLRLIEIAPGEISGYLGLARSYGDIENFAAALPVLRKVLELDPNNTQVHYQYATLMGQKGNLSLALKHYKIVAHLDASYPRIQKRLRMLEEEMDEVEPQSGGSWPLVNRSAAANTVARENAEAEERGQS